MPKPSGYLATLSLGILIGWSVHYLIPVEKNRGANIKNPLPIVIRAYPSSDTTRKTNESIQDIKSLDSDTVYLSESQLTLLDNRQFREFVGLYWNEKDPQRQKLFQNKIIDTVHYYLGSNRTDDALELIDAYLDFEYRDAAALKLKIDVQLKRGDYFDAIKTMYSLYGFEHRAEKLQDISRQIRETVSTFSGKLERERLYQRQLELYSYLTDIEPDYAPYFVEQAISQLRLHKNEEARQSLLLVEHDSRVSEQVQNLLQQFESAPDEKATDPILVPLSKIGDHFVVDALLNNNVTARLLIDTGASTTVIKSELIDSYFSSIPIDKKVRFNTANGTTSANLYIFNSLSINGLEVKNILVGGLKLDGMTFADGLLGMNFLKHYRFYIDQNQQELKLIPLE